MKKLPALACVIFAAGFSATLAAQLLGVIAFDVLTLPPLIGAVAASGLAALACLDYSRRPRFGARRTRLTASRSTAGGRPHAAAGSTALWTYTTFSA